MIKQRCMNSVGIHYMQPLTGLFPKRSENVKIAPGTTLSKLLENLFSTYREQFKKYEIDPTSDHIVIMLNGKTLSSKELNIELNDRDSLVLWMPVAGG